MNLEEKYLLQVEIEKKKKEEEKKQQIKNEYQSRIWNEILNLKEELNRITGMESHLAYKLNRSANEQQDLLLDSFPLIKRWQEGGYTFEQQRIFYDRSGYTCYGDFFLAKVKFKGRVFILTPTKSSCDTSFKKEKYLWRFLAADKYYDSFGLFKDNTELNNHLKEWNGYIEQTNSMRWGSQKWVELKNIVTYSMSCFDLDGYESAISDVVGNVFLMEDGYYCCSDDISIREDVKLTEERLISAIMLVNGD